MRARYIRERLCDECQEVFKRADMIRCDLCGVWRCKKCHCSMHHLGNCHEHENNEESATMNTSESTTDVLVLCERAKRHKACRWCDHSIPHKPRPEREDKPHKCTKSFWCDAARMRVKCK